MRINNQMFNRLTEVPLVDTTIALDSESEFNLMRRNLYDVISNRSIFIQSIIIIKYTISSEYSSLVKVKDKKE